MSGSIKVDLKNVPITRKLPIGFILVAFTASVLIGAVSYFKAADSLDKLEEQALLGHAAGRKSALSFYLDSIRQDLDALVENPALHRAMKEFKGAWDAIPGDKTAFLHEAYIAKNPNPAGEKHKLDAAPGDAAYNKVHAEHHPWIRKFLEERGYYDIFLFEPKGDLVYTVFKEADYATNVVTGKWKATDLGVVFRKAVEGAKRGNKVFTDFKAYAPSSGAPASFIGAPMFDRDGKLDGVLAFQMPVERINKVMQIAEGLGKTGETYIVGADKLWRSDSRFSKESFILKRKSENPGVALALEGKSGVVDYKNDRGDLTSAYVPIEFLGVKWVILASIELAEANASINELRLFVIVLVVVFVAGGSMLGLALARGVTDPLEAVTAGINAVAAGDTSAEIPGTERQDEIGTMARALTQIQGAARDAERLQTMVENMPINVMMSDKEDFKINYINKASRETLKKIEHLLPIKVDQIIGTSIDVFHKNPAHQRKMLADPKNLPHRAKIKLGQETLELNVAAIVDAGGHYIGPMVSWSVITDQMRIADEATSVTDLATKSAEQVLITTQSMVKGTEQSSSRSVDVADLAQTTLDRITAVAAATEELASSVSEVESQVVRASDVARSAVARADEANERVTGLAEAAKRIGNVVELIRDVAEQTNLLALNATIEAARAGDAGKGFAVVATEVKNLAAQTAKATEEISKQIESVQAETQESVAAIQEIATIIRDIDNITTEVRSAIEQQTEATREISSNVQESTAAMNKVTDNVSDVTQRNLMGMGAAIKVIWQTRKLLDPMNKLRNSIDEFIKR